MRYYVLCFSDYDDVSPHVIAEVVRDGANEDRETTLASALAGERAVVVTRAELEVDPVGRAALEDWEAGDDSAYYRETEAILADAVASRRLRVVKEDDEEESRRRRRRRLELPRDEQFREVLLRSRGLRIVTRSLIERAREQRAAIMAAGGKERVRRLEVADDGT
jgi:hypothetical protein